MANNKFTRFMQKAWAVIKRTAKRVWEYLKVAKMEWIVMIALFAVDLITKAVVAATVGPSNNPVVLIPNFLQINYTINKGAAYGSDFMVNLLTATGARIFFSVFAVAASVAFVLILIRNKGKNKLFRIGIAMFVAGAMGNCIDRMFLGYVRDFVHFSFQPYIFNIADAELVFGVALIVIYLLFFFHDSDKKAKKAASENADKTAAEQCDDKPAVADGATDASVDPDAGVVSDVGETPTVSDLPDAAEPIGDTAATDDPPKADGDGEENAENIEQVNSDTTVAPVEEQS